MLHLLHKLYEWTDCLENGDQINTIHTDCDKMSHKLLLLKLRIGHYKRLGCDSELSLVSHCKKKINRAYFMLGLIKRNLVYLKKEEFVTLYKNIVRSHPEYADSV